MTDSTHNTLVTILLIIAAVIVFVLLGRWFQNGSMGSYSYQTYSSQPASAVEVYRTRSYAPTRSYQVVRSVPQTQYRTSTTRSTTTYSYSCNNYGYCWTNQ